MTSRPAAPLNLSFQNKQCLTKNYDYVQIRTSRQGEVKPIKNETKL